jgi:hypothetical protein
VGGQRHAPVALPQGKRPGIHCTVSWVGPRGCPEGRKILASTEVRPPNRPARSQSLYRLSYPDAEGQKQHFKTVCGINPIRILVRLPYIVIDISFRFPHSLQMRLKKEYSWNSTLLQGLYILLYGEINPLPLLNCDRKNDRPVTSVCFLLQELV